MRKLPLFTLIFVSVCFFTQCKTSDVEKNDNETKGKKESKVSSSSNVYTKPKLVVGIVVDQMRYDYISRFWDKYEDDGFKRLISEGYNFKNAHYNYVPTYTAPGHTSIYTGTSPRYHGIIGNSFYDKFSGKKVSNATDNSVSPVGTESKAGKSSPKKLLATTFGDENRLATQFRGKTIGVSIKDRAAIMPAGHAANAAYWFHGKDEGSFITSSYYMDELPNWVKQFNESSVVEDYMKEWNTLMPIEEYTESGPDDSGFEHGFKGNRAATFPYDLKKLSEDNKGYDILISTPYGNNITTDFALAAIDGENLGQDSITDVLTVSYSSPDKIGHNFGVNSKEVQDNYLRLDRDIAKLLNELDEKVGEGNYTVFLTADHAGVDVPAYLKSKNIAAGYFKNKDLRNDLQELLESEYGSSDLVANISNRQVFFDYKKLEEEEIDLNEISDKVKHFLINYPKIAQVYTREMIEGSGYSTGMIGRRVRNGFNPKRSGDVVFELEPATISSHIKGKGTTHGSAYKYDTHIPMIFYGQGINQGQTTKETEIVDIAPTISALLGISFPNAATGKVLYEAID